LILKVFDLDLSSPLLPYEKHWELCVGSCHGTTALREDYRRQLEQCQREIGFRYVRFHGLFDDDMSVLTRNMRTGKTQLSFTNIDSIFDFLLSINMKPFVEIGFMPECLSSKNTTVFHYKGNTSPPNDYDKWAWLIREFIAHLIDRYGRDEVRQWFFEVWNEPNLGGPDSPFGFWSGSMEEYFKLYQVTAEAIKAVDSALAVGGPATSNNAWIPEMVDFCRSNHVPIDFISTHHYPTDVVLGYGVEDSQNFNIPTDLDMSDPKVIERMREQYAVFQSRLWERVDRGVLKGMTEKAVKEAEGLPVYYTEWNSLAGLPSDGPFGSSFLAKTVLDAIGLVKGYSYWTFSDIFEEGGMPSPEFHGGFGLLTLHGVPKASYRAFELLHSLGEKRYAAAMSEGTVDIYGFKKDASQSVQLLVINHHSLLHDIEEETVTINFFGLSAKNRTLFGDIMRIDDTHANSLACWEEMGSPEYPSPAQLHSLKAASYVERENFSMEVAESSAKVEVTVPPMGMALITLYL